MASYILDNSLIAWLQASIQEGFVQSPELVHCEGRWGTKLCPSLKFIICWDLCQLMLVLPMVRTSVPSYTKQHDYGNDVSGKPKQPTMRSTKNKIEMFRDAETTLCLELGEMASSRTVHQVLSDHPRNAPAHHLLLLLPKGCFGSRNEKSWCDLNQAFLLLPSFQLE